MPRFQLAIRSDAMDDNDDIDADGFRANVGIIVAQSDKRLLIAGRAGRKGWQFPQGGITKGERPEAAMYRELREELGLLPDHVELMGRTPDWISYRLPKRYVRRNATPLCIGQKQIWYLLRLRADEQEIHFDSTGDPEFDRYRWVDFWHPVNEVIYFKRRVYAKALFQLGGHLHPDGIPKEPRWWPQRWRQSFERDRREPKDTSKRRRKNGQ